MIVDPRAAGEISDNRQAVITPGDPLQSANVIFSDNQLFDLSPDGIVVLDEDGQILHANKSFLGFAEEDALAPIVGTSLDRWLGSPGGNLKLLVDSLRLCGSVRHFPITIKGALGGNTATEVSAVLKSSPAPAFIALYFHDVNSRPETSVQSEMLLEFLSGVVGPPGRASLKKVVSSTVGLVERFYIEAALEAVDGNRTAAARILGISRQGFYDKLARYHIDERPDSR
jgi:transcriptional regulator PpsR